MPVAQGMVGIYSAVASANHMAPWGGTESLLGTNPLAVGVPAGEEAPVILDIATTVVSYGTVKNYALQGIPMPEGWMVDRQTGAPITDAARSGEGVLMPIGGYKGSGLALVLGLLAGPLNGGVWSRGGRFQRRPVEPRRTPGTSSWRSISAGSSIAGCSARRWTSICGICAPPTGCRVPRRFACPATSGTAGASAAVPRACRSRRRCGESRPAGRAAGDRRLSVMLSRRGSP